jgi:hypothetical protein
MAPVNDALAMAILERSPDLVDDGEPIREGQLRVVPEEGVERHAAGELVEDHRGPELTGRGVVGDPEHVRVLAHVPQERGFAVGGSPQLRAPVCAGLLRDQVHSRAGGEAPLEMFGHAVLVARAVGQERAELVAAHELAALLRPKSEGGERLRHVVHDGLLDALTAVIGVRSGELVEPERLVEIGARDDSYAALRLEAEVEVGGAEEDEGLHEGAAAGLLHSGLKARLEDLCLQIAEGERPVHVAGAGLAGRRSPPFLVVALVAARAALDLDQVERRVPEHQEVDLVEPAGRGLEQLGVGPDLERVRVGQDAERELEGLSLVRVGRLTDDDFSAARESHRLTAAPGQLGVGREGVVAHEGLAGDRPARNDARRLGGADDGRREGGELPMCGAARDERDLLAQREIASADEPADDGRDGRGAGDDERGRREGADVEGRQGNLPGAGPLEEERFEVRFGLYERPLAPDVFGLDRREAWPPGTEGVVFGDGSFVEGRTGAERGRPLGVRVTQQKIHAVGGGEVTTEARPSRIGLGAESSAGGATALDVTKTGESCRVVSAHVRGEVSHGQDLRGGAGYQRRRRTVHGEGPRAIVRAPLASRAGVPEGALATRGIPNLPQSSTLTIAFVNVDEPNPREK